MDRHAVLVLVANAIFNVFQLMIDWGAEFISAYPGSRLKSEHHRSIRKDCDGTFRDFDIPVVGVNSLLASNILDSHWRVDPIPDLNCACPCRH